MNYRINLALTTEILEVIDRNVQKGDRSHFIDQAVQHYINATAKENLREKLKQGAVSCSERDLGISQDWFNVDEESWQNSSRYHFPKEVKFI